MIYTSKSDKTNERKTPTTRMANIVYGCMLAGVVKMSQNILLIEMNKI